MTKFTRREFLLSLAAGMGAVAANHFLAACSRLDGEAESTSLPAPTESPKTVDTPEANALTTDSNLGPMETPMGLPDVAVARGVGGNDVSPEDLVRRALTGLGGMERFVSKGVNVIVKPNICVGYHSYEFAATTNPWLARCSVRKTLWWRTPPFPWEKTRSGQRPWASGASRRAEVWNRRSTSSSSPPKASTNPRAATRCFPKNSEKVVRRPSVASTAPG